MNDRHHSDRKLLALANVLMPGAAAALLAVVFGVGWFTQPDRYERGFAPQQPIPYSHRIHAGTLKIPCLYCHGGAATSRLAGVPAVETCMNCHRVTKIESPHIQKLTKAFESGTPIFWRRVHALPDHVFFDHRPHVNGGIACQVCHGPVETMEAISQEMSLRMGNCLGCHRDPHGALAKDSKILQGPDHCNACHR